ncbi:MAG: tetratricopeptide repeat protein [Desulfosarcinaceae bacterium]
MTTKKLLLIIMALGIFSLAACGPKTILVRPGLDTPSQHISNGRLLLDRGKLDDAFREFERARELDPTSVHAHIGLGLVMGHKGDIQEGIANFRKAAALAGTEEEHNAVETGYHQFQSITGDKDPLQN